MIEVIHPIKLLNSYTRDDVASYFGREEEVRKLHEMVFQTDLILIYGPSGTGKTSIIQCGLANKFSQHDWLAITIKRSGKDINDQFNQALIENGGDYENRTDNEINWRKAEPTEKQEETELVKRIKYISVRYFKPIYLIFDQFEELFISGGEEEQKQFFENIKHLLHLHKPVKILISIREEYLGYLYDFEKTMPDLFQKKIRIEPMGKDSIKEILFKINKISESKIHLKNGEEEAVAEEIFKRLQKKKIVELTNLQVFLYRFYKNNKDDKNVNENAGSVYISMDSLNIFGGLDDILQEFLVDQVEEIKNESKIKDITQIWNFLAKFRTSENTKKAIPANEVNEELKKIETNSNDVNVTGILNTFIENQILKLSNDNQCYELAHDSLAKKISEKMSDKDAEIARVKGVIDDKVRINNNKKPGSEPDYFTEDQLKRIRKAIGDLNKDVEQEFKLPSGTAKLFNDSDFIFKKKEKRRKLRKKIFQGLSFIILILCVFASYQWYQANKAKENAIAQKNKADQLTKEAIEKEQQAKRLYDSIEAINAGLIEATNIIKQKDEVNYQIEVARFIERQRADSIAIEEIIRNFYTRIRTSKEDAMETLNEGLSKFPNSIKLNELKTEYTQIEK